MLTDAQIDHFRTFGFLVLRGYLDECETAALADELDRAHRDAFGARYDERPDNDGGMSGHYLRPTGTGATRPWTPRACAASSRGWPCTSPRPGPAT